MQSLGTWLQLNGLCEKKEKLHYSRLSLLPMRTLGRGRCGSISIVSTHTRINVGRFCSGLLMRLDIFFFVLQLTKLSRVLLTYHNVDTTTGIDTVTFLAYHSTRSNRLELHHCIVYFQSMSTRFCRSSPQTIRSSYMQLIKRDLQLSIVVKLLDSHEHLCNAHNALNSACTAHTAIAPTAPAVSIPTIAAPATAHTSHQP